MKEKFWASTNRVYLITCAITFFFLLIRMPEDGPLYPLRDEYEGYGTAVFTGKQKYEGYFRSGKMDGKGVYTWQDKVTYKV